MATKSTSPFELVVIGNDIGKDVFHLVGFNADGKIVLRKKIKRLALLPTFERLPRCIVGMEACMSAHFVSRTLRKLGFEPRIIPAIYVKPFLKGQRRTISKMLKRLPRQHSTGGKPILGRMSKRDSKYLRTLFIQAAHTLLMRPDNWKKLSFGPWLGQVAARLHKNKLAVALANKLARMVWSILRHGNKFDIHQDKAMAI